MVGVVSRVMVIHAVWAKAGEVGVGGSVMVVLLVVRVGVGLLVVVVVVQGPQGLCPLTFFAWIWMW